MASVTKGSLDGSWMRVVIVASRFNPEVCERLLGGARAGLAACGVPPDGVRELSVPGAVEIPLAARAAIHAGHGAVSAVVALGAVIRGETGHYDQVCSMAARGCLEVGLETGVPVVFGVLTCDSEAQALVRSEPGDGNKGHECARVAVEMANLLRDLAG
jgi:6,7-dimethyl-8-ribityllumazine synthase